MKELYEDLWAGGYRERKRDHQGRFYRFMGVVNPAPDTTIIDWGCGQGRLGYELRQSGFSVQMIDIASNSLDSFVKDSLHPWLSFINASIITAEPTPADYSACMDVLEHLKPEDVVPAVRNIIRHTIKEAYFLVALNEDTKTFNGKTYDLHLTVKSLEWWFKLFEKFGTLSHRCFFLDKHNHPMMETIIRLD